MRQEDLLVHRLERYGRTDMYPFHMPGHKRQEMEGFSNPFAIDITEIEGFDNLHHPEGILKESMEWAARVYGADRTYYLVNGSSCGILSAICGTVAEGGRILASRNCHKSAYHGIFLNRLQASYVYPQEAAGLGILGGVTAKDVDKMLKQYMDIQAVLIVSPTYDGVVSDVEGIAQAVHRAGLPLIVDEAHGAHFRYEEKLPISALELGADVVIQSVHKTMPSLTQTALLHIKNNRPDGGCYADAEGIRRYLSIYQSSSPSYVLMASIENSIFQMERWNMGAYMEGLYALREKLGNMKYLKLADRGLRGQAGIFDLDITKIVVSTRGAGLTGAGLCDVLRRKYHLEPEMCGADYVTAITTAMDSGDGLERLGEAVAEIDKGLLPDLEDCGAGRVPRKWNSRTNDIAMTISEAVKGKKRPVKLKESAGCISGEFIYVYPPGIPIVAPGEWMSKEALHIILDYIEKGLPVQGLLDSTLNVIQVVDKG